MKLTRRQLLSGGALGMVAVATVAGVRAQDEGSVAPPSAPPTPAPVLSWDRPLEIFGFTADDLTKEPDMLLPSKVLGVYWTGWTGGTRLTELPGAYNLIYLFAAHPGGAAGAVRWSYAPVSVADLKAVRAKGKIVLLSTGGAGGGINFDSRAKSQAFVDSVVAYRSSVEGQIDGVDFNTFEADAAPNLPEYIWIAQELKRRFPGFIVTSPPAPWSQRDKTFCAGMLKAGVMDYAAPQFYDGPGLSDPTYIVNRTAEWVRDVAAGDASKIVVGFGVNPGAADYSTPAQTQTAWKQIAAAHPNIRGAFVWQHATDKQLGWAFATGTGAAVGAVSTVPIAPTTPTTPTTLTAPTSGGSKVGLSATIGSSSFPLAGINVPRAAGQLVLYTGMAATTTNKYGVEVVIEKGVVTKVNDRLVSGSTEGTPIPAGAMVLSGHDAAATWLKANAKVGTAV